MTELSQDPGEPDVRSAGRYLWWLAVSQRRRVAAGAVFGTVWMLGLVLPSYLLSRAVDDGLKAGRPGALVGWSLALVVVGTTTALIGVARHRTMTKVRMDATFRTVRVVVRQAVRLGSVLSGQTAAGEVVTIGVADVQRMSATLTMTGPGVGAVITYLVVAALLLDISPLLAALVLLGVPLLALLIGPMLGRLQGAEARYRERQGRLAGRFEDMVGGLRVLHGLGGKEVYAARYRHDSQQQLTDGYRVGAVTSWIQSLGAGLPILFLAAVTWVAARLAAQGSITVGELVAVYGYTAALNIPVWFMIEGGQDLSRALVAARRTVRFLSLTPRQDGSDVPAPEGAEPLRDLESGVEVAPGRFTVLACARPGDSAAVVDRLARFTDAEGCTWGTVGLDQVGLATVRERILIADNEAALFAGSLRELLTGRQEQEDKALLEALEAAAALDVMRGLPAGFESTVDAEGRNLSGGQRQRLRLARALLADPEILLAVEPTSAVDSHTEAAMAAGLRAFRAGRTTLVTSTSPLLLDRADTVVHLVDGRVAATGPHRELLRDHPGYRALVTRDEPATSLPAPRTAEESVR
ncbi:ABC-type multidrug transport system fused ATPase/permease subunit [Kitasatospora gansuensis]|uniref:ABC-type multidrug transport system fused ATPase/permease subunit n=1 Tax=Kitasatospora gansuensis TaxID=258050 RepID=A0A7W7WL53_9ACTN|nr:ABC transporter ATP-binding protein [Kitasatospora gansuensis]MBB4950384.1 ABC-type multidrug transport system fused ATPase/permease subunit [Kitasatospora gansuensis]